MTTDEQQVKQPAPEEKKGPEKKPEKEPDKRQFPRAPFRVNVTVNTADFSGTRPSRDISLDGIFLESEGIIQKGQTVRLSIPFSNHDRHINMHGRIVRVSEDGIGIQFDIYAIDIE